MELKTCNKCGLEKPFNADHFIVTHKKRKDGTRYTVISSPCRECAKAKAKECHERSPHLAAKRRRQYKERLKTAGLFDRSDEYEKRKQKRKANKSTAIKRLIAALRKIEKCKKTPAKRVRGHGGVCWLWEKPGLHSAEKYRLRYWLDEEFRVSERIRRQITKKAKRDGVAELIRGALKRGGASRRAEALLGYTMSGLKAHLERQFERGMSWANMGEWHIDHIVPQRLFDMADDEQWRKCWCLSNLRPMWGRDNIAKSGRQTHLL